jgi:methionyl-tRNA formyltransferase
MRIAVLTTRTPHHCWFVRQLAERHPLALVMVETRRHAPQFPVHHSFEDDRDQFELETWFGGQEAEFADEPAVVEVSSANHESSLVRLADASPDIVITFGVGRLHESVLAICPDGIVNLHGGDPEQYRGLDTHLWAIYHEEFAGLVTTLHRIATELDAGEIILQAAVPVHRGMPLHALRRANTELCLRLTLEAIAVHAGRGRFLSHPQRCLGRYYSFMPSVLKELCVAKFSRYTEDLP